MGFSRREYWSGVPLPSPKMEHYIAIKIKKLCHLQMMIMPSEVKSDKRQIPCNIGYMQNLKCDTNLVLAAQSCPTLCDPRDCIPPGSSVHGILQARILEWVAISFSRASSQPRDGTRVSGLAGRFFTV